MQIITLYRYIRNDGGVTVSPIKPDREYAETFRLVADEGMILTDGENFTICTDTENPDAWTEVEDIENPDEEITNEEFLDLLEEVL